MFVQKPSRTRPFLVVCTTRSQRLLRGPWSCVVSRSEVTTLLWTPINLFYFSLLYLLYFIIWKLYFSMYFFIWKKCITHVYKLHEEEEQRTEREIDDEAANNVVRKFESGNWDSLKTVPISERNFVSTFHGFSKFEPEKSLQRLSFYIPYLKFELAKIRLLFWPTYNILLSCLRRGVGTRRIFLKSAPLCD